MKKGIYFIMSAVLAFVFSSCAPKPMGALDPSYFSTNPNPLQENGGKVVATVTGKFPPKYFDKKTVVVVTPVLKTSTGVEYKGTPVSYQGEKIQGNNQQISYELGGTFTQQVAFDYKPDMAKSELFLQFSATRGKKTYEIPSVKVADGVIATATLAAANSDNLNSPIVPDKFQRIIQEKQDANIMFLIQQANLRPKELKQAALLDLIKRIKEAQDSANLKVYDFGLHSFASPDGGLKINEPLSLKREKNTKTYLDKQMKKLKADVNLDATYTAEDWDGFKNLMEASNIQDKEVILRVLSMYDNAPDQRMAEIKDLAAVYKTIAKDILPQLRRSKVSLIMDVIGKSDEQISQLAQNDPSKLTVEELLYAATLTNDPAQKAAIYQKVIDIYPNDMRGYNNLGTLDFNKGDYAEAGRLFAKALAIEPNSPQANYNMAIIALAQGDAAKAQQYLGNAGNLGGNDVNQALGIIYLQQGDYDKAKAAFGDAATNNAAIAQIMTKDYSAARNTLNNVKTPDGETNYLLAVVGARTNDRQLVYDSMRKAVAANADWGKKAMTDAEFAKYLTDSDFMNIIK
ncbi:tetratricopeptide repeat protein [Microbacter margulisiae]|uniref:Flp pilus assembly protein TadD n=1 Tax=Microbacter margulisiae TaxID=1350067 RepID=A0A7W5DSS2_9PORP|nr:tetratricopeptide repeat protein [Microbacter margulisiae]MBB3188251.1 Flp pilus assembly protein TadD [Microbacter margulisiae]